MSLGLRATGGRPAQFDSCERASRIGRSSCSLTVTPALLASLLRSCFFNSWSSLCSWLRRLALRGMAHTKVNAVVFICFFNEKIFQSIFAVRRRERLLADLAMDQSMRE